jgi:hypothetical protein
MEDTIIVRTLNLVSGLQVVNMSEAPCLTIIHALILLLPTVISLKDIYFLPCHIFIRNLFSILQFSLLSSFHLSSLSFLEFLFFMKSAIFKNAGNQLRVQIRPLLNSLLVDVDAIATG